MSLRQVRVFEVNMAIELEWQSDDADAMFNIYRSTGNINPLNPPDPIAVNLEITTFLDSHDHVVGETYNYRIATTKNGITRPEWFSEQQSFEAE